MSKFRIWIALLGFLFAVNAEAVIYLQVKTTVGNMTLELYDQQNRVRY